jgi:hypothetical protein
MNDMSEAPKGEAARGAAVAGTDLRGEVGAVAIEVAHAELLAGVTEAVAVELRTTVMVVFTTSSGIVLAGCHSTHASGRKWDREHAIAQARKRALLSLQRVHEKISSQRRDGAGRERGPRPGPTTISSTSNEGAKISAPRPQREPVRFGDGR